jgi:16S rRNA (guanine966-N2)-methyltransferase
VLSLEGLRPTPDRVRETLFNCLQGNIYQARCLDLFAGSGALGFEAISRGAAQLVMVEKHRLAAQQLTQNIALLKTDQILLQQDDAYHYLDSESEPFDLIFLDPPFRQGHVEKLLHCIMQAKLLTPQGLLYVEYESEISIDISQWNFTIIKQIQAGQSQALLLKHCN